jgi:hypothetical protein
MIAGTDRPTDDGVETLFSDISRLETRDQELLLELVRRLAQLRKPQK